MGSWTPPERLRSSSGTDIPLRSIAALRVIFRVCDFCAAFPIWLPIALDASTLRSVKSRALAKAEADEFHEGLRIQPCALFYFISSRLRLKLQTKDFRTGMRRTWLATLADSLTT